MVASIKTEKDRTIKPLKKKDLGNAIRKMDEAGKWVCH